MIPNTEANTREMRVVRRRRKATRRDDTKYRSEYQGDERL